MTTPAENRGTTDYRLNHRGNLCMTKHRKVTKREPNGRASRKKVDVATRRKLAWDKAENDAVSVGIEARQRLFGVSAEQSRDQRAGSFVGRLCMAGKISPGEYDALLQYQEAHRAFYMTIPGPKEDSALDPNRVHGRSNRDSTEADRLARERYKEANDAVDAAQIRDDEAMAKAIEAGWFLPKSHLHDALYHCVIRDREISHFVPSLQSAATALARHFKFENGRVAA